MFPPFFYKRTSAPISWGKYQHNLEINLFIMQQVGKSNFRELWKTHLYKLFLWMGDLFIQMYLQYRE